MYMNKAVKDMKEQAMTRILTKRSFRKNKGRNLVAILAVTMTTMMFTTLFTLAQSMGKTLTEMYLHQSGTSAHASCKEMTDEQISQIAAHPDVEKSGWSIVVGLAENPELAGRQVEIRYGTDQYAEDDFAYPVTGRMPKDGTEIALDTLTLERLGIDRELGEEVSLLWRKDIHSDEMTESVFTLCGFWEGNLSVYASMAWVSEEFAMEACGGENAKSGQICGMRMMGISFDNTDHIEEKTERVLSDCGLFGLDFRTNLVYSDELQKSILMENLPTYGGMALVFIAGYLIIFNVFQISVASDIQFYGKLKTLGMTKKQIRRMILGQGCMVSLAGLPGGLLLGYFLGIVLLPVLISKQGTVAVISANPVIFMGSAAFTFVTVLVSCMLPAQAAGKVSPIEALRYTDGDGGAKKKSRKRENGSTLSGMAWANLWRNPKRTFLVIGSLTLGMVLMSFFYAKNVSFDMEKYLIEFAASDFQIDDATNENAAGYDPASCTIGESLVADILAQEGMEGTGRLYCREVSMPVSEQACENFQTFYTEEALEDFASYDPTFPKWKEKYDEMLAKEDTVHTIYGADGLILEAAAEEKYVMAGEYDAEKFAEGDYVLAIGPSAEGEEVLPTYSVGEKLRIEGREFTVMAVLLPMSPLTEGMRAVFDIPLVIPSNIFTQLWPDSNLRKFYFNIDDNHMEEASELLKEYQQTKAVGMNIVSREEIKEQYQAETRSSAVIGYAISFVVALVGILNFINSMVTAIISRKKEFAMIQSVGMTKWQLRRMLTFEGLYYAGITLAVSYVLGSVTVGILLRMIVPDSYSTFQFTLLPLIVCTPILLVLAVLIPYICFQKLEKRSVAERLRMAD